MIARRSRFTNGQGIVKDLGRAKSLREIIAVVSRAPGWRANGLGKTAADLRAEYEAGLSGAPPLVQRS